MITNYINILREYMVVSKKSIINTNFVLLNIFLLIAIFGVYSKVPVQALETISMILGIIVLLFTAMSIIATDSKHRKRMFLFVFPETIFLLHFIAFHFYVLYFLLTDVQIHIWSPLLRLHFIFTFAWKKATSLASILSTGKTWI